MSDIKTDVVTVSIKDKFTDFARNEIYAFHRLTAILTTFLLSASFTIFTIRGGFNGTLDKIFFQIALYSGITTILLVWWRLYRTLFNYYNELDNPCFMSTKIYKSISDNEGKWRKGIWAIFFICFVSSIGYLLTIVYN